MQIYGINNFNSNACNFKNLGRNIKKADVLPKRIIQSELRQPHFKTPLCDVVLSTTSNLTEEMEKLLKSYGITYFAYKDNTISLVTRKNGGFYTMQTPIKLDGDKAKMFVLTCLAKGQKGLGGIKNYIKCLDDLKRQDIVKKGLRISSYDVNINTPEDFFKEAAYVFSYARNEKINPDEIFFLEDDAIHYDAVEKIAYSIHDCRKFASAKNREVFSCKFLTDEKGNTIGYKMKHIDPYSYLMSEKTYIEQQSPSETLQDIVYDNNNKDLAEAFRFGNSKAKTAKEEVAVSRAIEDIKKKLNIQNITDNEIQFARISDESGNITTRINHYNPNTGLSLTYNEEGKYLGQMEYVKNAEGSIIAVTKF